MSLLSPASLPAVSQRVAPLLEKLVYFALGLLTPLIVGTIGARILQRPPSSCRHHGRRESQKSIYGLQHSILNIELPPKTMWMNLGYWKSTQSDFTRACTALLEEVLLEARVVRRRDGVVNLCRTLDIIDVGFGCGDQSLYLAQLNQAHSAHRLSSYTGITKDRKQFDYAVQRFHDHGLSGRKDGSRRDSSLDFRIYCADAADPDKWDTALLSAMERFSGQACQTGSERWLLGLDTLYHFSPSRKGIFDFAARNLDASIMAFDLAFPEDKKPGLVDSVLLRLFCMVTSTPYRNLLSISDYRAQLAASGYDIIVMKDISEHVFDPLVNYLHQRDAQLQVIGRGLGSLRIAGWVFKWWARNNLVGAYIVVAKKLRSKQVDGLS